MFLCPHRRIDRQTQRDEEEEKQKQPTKSGGGGVGQPKSHQKIVNFIIIRRIRRTNSVIFTFWRGDLQSIKSKEIICQISKTN